MAWIDPYFVTYGDDLGRRMTNFLYEDPSVQQVGSLEEWHHGPKPVFVNRNFNIPAVTVGVPGTVDVDFGGKNVLVFARTYAIRDTPLVGVATQLPNQTTAIGTMRLTTRNGRETIESEAGNLIFGQTGACSWVYPQPLFWYGRDQRELRATATNLSGPGTITVDTAFLICLLDDGR